MKCERCGSDRGITVYHHDLETGEVKAYCLKCSGAIAKEGKP